jgi:hypothetical protein
VKHKEYLRIKQETYTNIVWVTQDVPNSRLSLFIAKQLQMSTIDSIHNLVRVARLTSPHKDTHTQFPHIKTRSSQQLSQLLWCALDMRLPETHYLLYVARFHGYLRFCLISCLTQSCHKTSANSKIAPPTARINPNKFIPTIFKKSPQGSTSPPIWSDLAP